MGTRNGTTNKRRRMRAVDRTFSGAFKNYKPPENLTVSQWAAKNRILSRDSSAESGPWRNERTPYLVEPMDAFTDPKVWRITFVSSSQCGKSEYELNCIGYVIDQDPGSMMYIQPTIDDAKKFSKQRIAPMIRDCPKLRRKVADVKSRDSSNTTLQKSFPGGMLTIVGTNSASALASTPVRYILGDERDRWALSAGTEGDPWKLAEARTKTFYNRKLVDVSTPTVKDASPIAESFYEGTQEHWQHQCPECGEFHEINFDDIKFQYEENKAGKKTDYNVTFVEWCCPSCGCLSSEDTMRQQPTRWHADNPDAIQKGHRSFWLNGFASPWQRWETIVYEFLKARKDPEKLKVVYNTMLGKLWEERGELDDEGTYLGRREDYGTMDDGTPVDLPDGVLVLTCGVDTQDDRLEYEVVGWGRYDENWGIKKGIILGDPNDDEVWEQLDQVIDRIYRFRNGRGLMISVTCVDSGGHKTQSVYRHCRDRLHKRMFAIKGVGGDGVPFTRPPSKVKIVVDGKSVGNTWLYALGVDAGKATIVASLKVQEPGPKYCHFPSGEGRGYDLAFFNGLLSERLVRKTERGRTRWAWEKIPGHERNEPFDCRNYALAAYKILDPDLDAVEEMLRTTADPQSKPKEQKRKRHGVIRRQTSDDW